MTIYENSSMTTQPSQMHLTMAKYRKEYAALQGAIGKMDLRKQYREKPITLHKTYRTSEAMQWPRVIKQAYAQIWSGKYPRVIIKAPRGGGKSKLLGTIGFDLWYLKRRKVVNMGGSAVQATIVYNYFKDYCDIDASIINQVQGRPKAIMTTATEGHYFSSVTASTKQTRGKHPDVFISDETCETSDELIHSALPMVDSSQNPLVIMASTFHKIYGIFQETWDAAAERGYLRLQWDIFDVTKPYPADYWEKGVLTDGTPVNTIMGVDKLKKHARGRVGDADGWVPIENIIQAWREKPTEDWFEVEYLGSRPSAAGLVLKPEDIDRAAFDSDIETRYNFMKGATVVMGIDWGFSSMTATTELMKHKDQVVVMIGNKNYHQTGSDTIIEEVVEKVRAHGIRFIYADSAGKFENFALQNALAKAKLSCKVVEVVFSKEKEGMLGNLRAHFEQGKYKFPKHYVEAYWQYKRYRYQEGTDKPVKKDDHIPDSTMCALQHFKLGQFARPMSVTKDPQQKPSDDKPITAGLMKKQF